MNLNLITGRAKSGKSKFLFDIVKNKFKSDVSSNIIYIVPEQMTYATELEFIDNVNEDGLLDMRVTSFKKLEYAVLEEVGGIKLQEINDYGKIMLIKQVCTNLYEELEIYKKATYKEGFLKELNNLISELKGDRITVEILENLDTSKISSELLKRKINDVIKIFKAVNEITKDNYFDSKDKTDFFISAISKSEYIRNSYVFIDNFESFTNQRIEVIKELIRCSKGVYATINIDNRCIDKLENTDDFEVFKITYNMLEQYKKISSELEIKINLKKLEENYYLNEVVKTLDKGLFTISMEEFLKDVDFLNVSSSMNTNSEIENICRNIATLVREKGYRYKDMAVIASNMDVYGSSAEKIFAKYDIPVFMDTKKDIMSNPFVKFIFSVLDMLNYNFKHESVFEYFKSGFSCLETFDISEKNQEIENVGETDIHKLENFALEYGIERNRWFKKFTMNRADVEYFENLRLLFSNYFDGKRKEFKTLKTAEDITIFLYKIFKDHDIQNIIDKKVTYFRNIGYYEVSSINAQVWNLIIGMLEQTILTSKDSEISGIQYKKMLEAGLNEVKIGVIPPTIDKVTVGTLDRAFIKEYKVIFLAGANEGVLLAGGDDKGIFLDEDRSVLKSLGINLQNSNSYKDYKDKHALYKVVTKPTDYLFVSYALSTSEGVSLQPSIYIDRLKQMFSKLIVKSELSIDSEIDFVVKHKATEEILIEKLRDFTEGKKLDEIWKDVYVWYVKNSQKTIEFIEQALNYNNKVEKVKDEFILKLYGENLQMSVSKLEDFASCPFKFFLDFGIKPLPRKEIKIEHYDLGNIYHECIELFTNKIIDKTINVKVIDDDGISIEISNCIDIVLGKHISDNSALDYNERNKYVKEKIKRLLKRAAKTIVNQLKKGNFTPKYTEYEIKKEIFSESKNISLKGIVDRVDVFKKDEEIYLNIIDYKSSRKNIDLNYAVKGLQMQLLMYLSSFVEEGKKIEDMIPKIGGVYYFRIDDPMIDADDKETEDVSDEIFKALSLKGYISDDMTVVENMDTQIKTTKKSDVIPVGLKKDDSFTQASKVLDNKEFNVIIETVNRTASKLTNDIFAGKIEINPAKKERDGETCNYCDYQTICNFDPSTEGNEYNYVPKRSKEEVIDNLLLEKLREDSYEVE